MSSKDSPEFWKVLDNVLFPVGRDIELIDLDTDLQRFLWTSIILVLTENLTPLLELHNYIRSCLRQNPVGYVLECIEKYTLPHLDRWFGGGEPFGDQSSTTALLGNRLVKID
ncbi:hypothetical protein EDD85DRAFT_948261 [Armillaria nabsnona]|nr:hypothetical protein EDD85DRAFT_948261 [Armillaria nabsnona]